MPFHRVNDIDIYYESGGDGPRLLYISGSGGDLRRGPRVLDGPLSEHFEILAYDQRGLGQTTRPDATYTMQQYADDAAGLLDVLGWESCRVVGVSFGGMVAQELAIRHPQRVERAVFACSSPGGAGGSSYPIQEYLDMSPEEAARRSLPVQDTRRDDEWQAAHPDDVRATIDQRRARLAAWAADPQAAMGYRRQLEARWAHDTFDRLREIELPVLIAGGRYDDQAPPANQVAMHDRLPNSRLEFFEGGHGFIRQDPTAFERIIAFLQASPR